MKNTRILLTMLLLLWPAMVLFAAPAGTLFLEKGKVRIKRNQIHTTYTEVGSQIQVHSGDQIQTGADTRAIIKLTEKGDDIELSSSTFFSLTEISEKKQEVFMPVGKAKIRVKKRSRPRRFSFKTANAVISVKGTEFLVGSNDGETSLLTLEGIVILASIDQPELLVEVPINQASQLQTDGKPTIPVVVPPEVRNAILNSDSPQVFKTVIFGQEVQIVVKKPTEKKEGEQDKGDGGGEESSDKEDPETDEEDPEQDEEEPETDVDDEVDDVEDIIDEVTDDVEEETEAIIKLNITN